MSSSYGENLRLTIFGQSHAPAVGMTLEGIPAGLPVDTEALGRFLARRAPRGQDWATARREADKPEFLCGLKDNVTCGTPITAVIRNGDVRSGDYEELRRVPRPGHADYTAAVKYYGFQDYAGGGHFSGRLTAPLCVAGGICLQLLGRSGVTVISRIAAIGGVEDRGELLASTADKPFPTVDEGRGEEMRRAIAAAKAAGDSLGGIIECRVLGLPAGLGDPMFGGMENRLAAVLFGIPAVKGVEFGAGFAAARLRGSENNDPFVLRAGRVETATNNCGGLLGGVTDGMPLVFRAAFKPTPSIAKTQRSVDLSTMTETELSVSGRHDPCVVPRALPCVEAAAAIALCDAMISFGSAGEELAALRGEIDRVDGDLQTLFETRMALVEKIAAFKKAQGLPVLDAVREAEKLLSVNARAAAGMADYDAALFRELMALSRRRQEKLLGGEEKA